MTPLISLIMPNRNKGPYLAKALHSLLHQSYKKWELILTDCNSTDNSVSVMAEFSADPRIHQVSTGGKTIGAVRRELMKKAQGSIIAVLDSDDYLAPEALAVMAKAHSEHKSASLIYSQYQECGADGAPLRVGGCRLIKGGESNLTADCISHLVTFKKSAYLQTSGYNANLPLAEDLDLILKLEEIGPVCFVNQPLYYYRVLPTSLSNTPRGGRRARAYAALVRCAAFERRLGHRGLPGLPKSAIRQELYQGCISALKGYDVPLAYTCLQKIWLL